MSFEAIIMGLVTLLFIIGPSLVKRQQKPEQEQPPQRGRGQPPPDTQVQTQRAAGADDWLEKLEEARRRIAEALGEETAGQQKVPVPAAPGPRVRQTQAKTVPGRPAPATARSAGPAPAATGIDWQQVTTRPPTEHSAAAAAARDRAAAERTRRLREASTASAVQVTAAGRKGPYTAGRRKRQASDLFGSDSVLNGYIWHQILSEPPHRRGNRRKVSRLRSP